MSLSMRRRHHPVPTVVQHEDNESGAVCLAMVLRAAGRSVPLPELRQACHVDRDGVSPSDLVAAAERYGLAARVVTVAPTDLRDLEPPVIVQWRFTRYVVVEGWAGDRWLLHDPVLGRRDCHSDEFAESFTGTAITVSRAPDFRPGGHPTGPLRRALGLAGDLRAVIWYFCMVAVLLVVPTLLVPQLIKLYAGGLNGAAGIATLSAVIGLAVAAGIQGLLQWLQGRLSVAVGTKVSLRLDVELLHRLLGLPLDYFRRRSAASLTQRLSLVDQVSSALSSVLLTGVTAALTAVAGIVALLVIDWITGVTAIVVAVLGMWFVHRLVVGDRDAVVRMMHEHLRFGIEIGSVFEQIAAVKASGHQRTVIARGLDLHHRFLRAEQRLELRSLLLRAMPQFLGTVGTVIIAAAAAQRVLADELSVGGFAAVLALAALTITPTVTAVTSLERVQGLGAALDRLDDVLTFPHSSVSPGTQPPERIVGELSVDGVSVAHSPWADEILRDITLEVPAGGRLAIVARSGNGLTSLGEVLAGIAPPRTGEIRYDGVTIPDWGARLVGQVALVRQDERTFDFTWRENITMFDPAVDDAAVQRAIRDAQLVDLVNSRPDGLDTQMQEYGQSMSAGQWQCVALARAFARDPAVLILDGATHSLDRATEAAVDRAIRERGMTCIVIGHRSGLMADDDEVVVVDGLGVVERGTAAQLRTGGRLYPTLVTS